MYTYGSAIADALAFPPSGVYRGYVSPFGRTGEYYYQYTNRGSPNQDEVILVAAPWALGHPGGGFSVSADQRIALAKLIRARKMVLVPSKVMEAARDNFRKRKIGRAHV